MSRVLVPDFIDIDASSGSDDESTTSSASSTGRRLRSCRDMVRKRSSVCRLSASVTMSRSTSPKCGTHWGKATPTHHHSLHPQQQTRSSSPDYTDRLKSFSFPRRGSLMAASPRHCSTPDAGHAPALTSKLLCQAAAQAQGGAEAPTATTLKMLVIRRRSSGQPIGVEFNGTVVQRVAAGGAADAAGVVPGMRIIAVNSQRLRTCDDNASVQTAFLGAPEEFPLTVDCSGVADAGSGSGGGGGGGGGGRYTPRHIGESRSATSSPWLQSQPPPNRRRASLSASLSTLLGGGGGAAADAASHPTPPYSSTFCATREAATRLLLTAFYARYNPTDSYKIECLVGVNICQGSHSETDVVKIMCERYDVSGQEAQDWLGGADASLNVSVFVIKQFLARYSDATPAHQAQAAPPADGKKQKKKQSPPPSQIADTQPYDALSELDALDRRRGDHQRDASGRLSCRVTVLKKLCARHDIPSGRWSGSVPLDLFHVIHPMAVASPLAAAALCVIALASTEHHGGDMFAFVQVDQPMFSMSDVCALSRKSFGDFRSNATRSTPSEDALSPMSPLGKLGRRGPSFVMGEGDGIPCTSVISIVSESSRATVAVGQGSLAVSHDDRMSGEREPPEGLMTPPDPLFDVQPTPEASALGQQPSSNGANSSCGLSSTTRPKGGISVISSPMTPPCTPLVRRRGGESPVLPHEAPAPRVPSEVLRASGYIEGVDVVCTPPDTPDVRSCESFTALDSNGELLALTVTRLGTNEGSIGGPDAAPTSALAPPSGDHMCFSVLSDGPPEGEDCVGLDSPESDNLDQVLGTARALLIARLAPHPGGSPFSSGVSEVFGGSSIPPAAAPVSPQRRLRGAGLAQQGGRGVGLGSPLSTPVSYPLVDSVGLQALRPLASPAEQPMSGGSESCNITDESSCSHTRGGASQAVGSACRQSAPQQDPEGSPRFLPAYRVGSGGGGGGGGGGGDLSGSPTMGSAKGSPLSPAASGGRGGLLFSLKKFAGLNPSARSEPSTAQNTPLRLPSADPFDSSEKQFVLPADYPPPDTQVLKALNDALKQAEREKEELQERLYDMSCENSALKERLGDAETRVGQLEIVLSLPGAGGGEASPQSSLPSPRRASGSSVFTPIRPGGGMPSLPDMPSFEVISELNSTMAELADTQRNLGKEKEKRRALKEKLLGEINNLRSDLESAGAELEIHRVKAKALKADLREARRGSVAARAQCMERDAMENTRAEEDALQKLNSNRVMEELIELKTKHAWAVTVLDRVGLTPHFKALATLNSFPEELLQAVRIRVKNTEKIKEMSRVISTRNPG